MKVAVFSTKPYTRQFLDAANEEAGNPHEFVYLEPRLTPKTVSLAEGAGAVCAFVNDTLSREVLEALKKGGAEVVALRSTGYNNVDLDAAGELGFCICRVPEYSPNAVAEHAVGLMLALNRKIHRAHARIHDSNFALDGLLGFDMYGKTAGIVGTGRIGAVAARILAGFGCNILAFDPKQSPVIEETGGIYVPLDELLAKSDIVTLHCPLLPATHHMIDWNAVEKMKPGVMLVNTSRGALIDTRAAIAGLKTGRIGYLGLDVYEEEGGLFFEDLSNEVIQDDVFARLMTFPNVIVTGHQAFFTKTALREIGRVTVANILAFEEGRACENAVTPKT